MAQLKQTCTVTNGSQTVTFGGVNLTPRIHRRHIFMVEGELVPYTVAVEPVFDGTNTIVTLTGAYAGITSANAIGVVVTDLTYPDSIPLIEQGDVGTAAVFSAAMYKIQDMIKGIDPAGFAAFADEVVQTEVAVAGLSAEVAAMAATVASSETLLTNAVAAAGDAQAASTTATTAAEAATAAATTATTKATSATASAASADASRIAAANSEAALAASLAQFRALFLGSFPADPTVDGNGQPLVAGAEYLNTTSQPNKLRVYDGVAWSDYDASAQTATQNAVSSAAAAASSAGAAALSETNASTSASVATASATVASTAATASANSATASSNSASAAATSASEALASKQGADSSAGVATVKAAEAVASATAAATSATNASTSAAQALTLKNETATSATSAGASATAAATSATAAATSEASALASKNAAATSAAAALASQNAAATSETNAAQSALSALASQNAAATSASNAGTSEVNAAASATTAGNASTAATASATAAAASNTSAVAAAASAAASALDASNSASAASIASSTATTKASEASSSSTSAAASATIATTKASECATSASAAAGSKTLAETAAADAATYATTASQALTDAQEAVTLANTTLAQATNAVNVAQASVTLAQNSASAAAASATSIGNAETTVTTAATKASKWADEAPNVEVEPGKFSARHWAAQVQASVAGALIYRGSIDASITHDYPPLPELGDYYRISVGGVIGTTTYAANDAILWNGSSWDWLNLTQVVKSVAGRTGNITLDINDIQGLGGAATRNVGIGSTDVASGNHNHDSMYAPINAVATHEAAGNPHPQYATPAEAAAAAPVQSVAGKTGTVALVKADVGLGNVDNTSDANKPISTATQTALNGKQASLGFTPENVANKGVANGYAGLGADGTVPASQLPPLSFVPTSEKGAANGVAPLDATGKVASTYLPSYVDDVLEYANQAAFPGTGEAGKIYVSLDSNKPYRWSGTVYVEISASPGSTDAVPEGSSNLYFTYQRVRDAVLTGLSTATSAVIAATDSVLTALGKLQAQITSHTGNTSNPHATTAAQVGAMATSHAANSITGFAGPGAATTVARSDGVMSTSHAANAITGLVSGGDAGSATTVARSDHKHPSNRNAIINGDFRIWQRGTPIIPALGSVGLNAYTADRWVCYQTGAAMQVMLADPNMSSLGIKHSAQWAGNAGNTQITWVQMVESVNAAPYSSPTTPITVSLYYYLASAKSITVYVDYANVVDNFTTWTNVDSYTYSHTGSGWERITRTLTPNANMTNGFRIRVTQMNATVSGGITGVQVEVGSSASPFASRSFGEELTLCQRYYEKTFPLDVTPAQAGGAPGALRLTQVVGASTQQLGGWLQYMTRKRANATVTYYNPVAANGQAYNSTIGVDCSTTGGSSHQNGVVVSFVSPAGSSAGNMIQVHITADAEIT